MPQFKSTYTCDDLVEFQNQPGDAENKFGFIRGVSFRRVDAVNHVATYTIHLCNKGEVVQEVTEDEIIKLYSIDECKRV